MLFPSSLSPLHIQLHLAFEVQLKCLLPKETAFFSPGRRTPSLHGTLSALQCCLTGITVISLQAIGKQILSQGFQNKQLSEPPKKGDSKWGSRCRKLGVRGGVQCSLGSRLSGTLGDGDNDTGESHVGTGSAFYPQDWEEEHHVGAEFALGTKRAQCLEMSQNVWGQWLGLFSGTEMYMLQKRDQEQCTPRGTQGQSEVQQAYFTSAPAPSSASLELSDERGALGIISPREEALRTMMVWSFYLNSLGASKPQVLIKGLWDEFNKHWVLTGCCSNSTGM